MTVEPNSRQTPVPSMSFSPLTDHVRDRVIEMMKEYGNRALETSKSCLQRLQTHPLTWKEVSSNTELYRSLIESMKLVLVCISRYACSVEIINRLRLGLYGRADLSILTSFIQNFDDSYTFIGRITNQTPTRNLRLNQPMSVQFMIECFVPKNALGASPDTLVEDENHVTVAYEPDNGEMFTIVEISIHVTTVVMGLMECNPILVLSWLEEVRSLTPFLRNIAENHFTVPFMNFTHSARHPKAQPIHSLAFVYFVEQVWQSFITRFSDDAVKPYYLEKGPMDMPALILPGMHMTFPFQPSGLYARRFGPPAKGRWIMNIEFIDRAVLCQALYNQRYGECFSRFCVASRILLDAADPYLPDEMPISVPSYQSIVMKVHSALAFSETHELNLDRLLERFFGGDASAKMTFVLQLMEEVFTKCFT